MSTAPRGKFWRLIRALRGAGSVLVLTLVGWLWWNLDRPLPSDSLLRQRFNDHRREFDQLAALAQADSQLVGAGHDGMLRRFDVYVRDTPHSNRRLTDEEVRATGRHELRRLLDRARMPSMSRSAEGSAIRFVVMSGGGSRKGILFSEEPMVPERSFLDDVERTSGYVALAPRWFMFVEPSD